jgi:hypothetical protein
VQSTHWIGGPRSGLDDVEGGKKMLPLLGLEPSPPDHPAHNDSLHHLNYLGTSINIVKTYLHCDLIGCENIWPLKWIPVF